MFDKNLTFDSAAILCESTPDSKEYWSQIREIQYILEDANSPITAKYTEKLFQSVIDKGHIDFGDIATSKGDITKYSGYVTMMETLDTLSKLGKEQRSNVVKYVETVQEAIKTLTDLGTVYQKGFKIGHDYVMLEYNSILYACVEATTTLIYEYVDFVKRPDKPTYVIALKNTKLRANQFYFDQLNSFNRVNRNMATNHRKWLEALLNTPKDHFTGDDATIYKALGMGVVAAVTMMIVPMTRSLIYHIYHLRSNLAQELTIQANFLEMNRSCVEANQSFTQEKRDSILRKQDTLRKKLLGLADKIKVKEAKALRDSSKEIEKDNSALTVSGIREEIENSPFDIV